MRLTALLALLAVSAVLAACGSSYGGSDDSKSDSSAASDASSGVVVCTAACVGTWPPAIVSATTGLPKHVATVKRPDGGKLQLTYDGHPLYRYAGDQSKADANGEGVGGQWFVVKASAGAGSAASKPAKPNTMGYNSGY